jgi:hypothetical protein
MVAETILIVGTLVISMLDLLVNMAVPCMNGQCRSRCCGLDVQHNSSNNDTLAE